MDQENAKRSKNFTDLEKDRLFQIAVDFKHIVENKKNDKTSIRLKNEAWDEITNIYNANCQTGFRNAKQLHALYDTIKKKAKKSLNEEKKNIYETGGIFFAPVSYEPEKQISTVIKQEYDLEYDTSLENKFDSCERYFEEPTVTPEEEITETISNRTDLDKPDETSESNTDILQMSPPPPLEASNSSTSQTTLPGRKRKNENIDILTKRIVDRKKFYMPNRDVYKKNEKILATELMIKERELAVSNCDLMIKEKDLKIKERELELRERMILLKNEEIMHTRKIGQIELEIKEKELEIKKWEHSIKFDEYKFYVENMSIKNS